MIEDSLPEEISAPTIESASIIMPEKLRPVFMNSYEKYEFLISNGCTNPEERKWLQNYKNSEEYKLIYEDN